MTRIHTRTDDWIDVTLKDAGTYNAGFVCIEIAPGSCYLDPYVEAPRVRDLLTAVIDAAGPRPLHPLIRGERANYAGEINLGPNEVQKISDALYELDEHRQREGQGS